MKIIVISKALLLLFVLSQKKWALCEGKKASESESSAGQGAKTKSDDKRKAIVLDIGVKSCNQYQYTRSGNCEKFTVYQGFKISEVKKNGKVVWTHKSGKFAKEIIIDTTTNKLRAVYLKNV